MSIHTLTEQLDDLYTTTWYNMRGTVIDQIFDATPFWAWLKANQGMKTEEGGREIQEPLEYAKNENIVWLGRGGTVSLDDYEHLTVARYDWRYQVGNIVRFGIDDQQNRGKAKILSRMERKLDNTKRSLIDAMESTLFQGVGSESTGIDGLQALVPDSPAAAVTYGGIDPATNTWWQNQATNATGRSFATYGIDDMRTLLNNCGQGTPMDTPNLILSGQTPYEWYESATLEHLRIQSTKMADLGFMNQTFKGIPMVWAPSCANSRMYMLNTQYLYYTYDPAYFFDMTEWKAIPDQVNDRAAQIMTACALTCSRRRCQGVYHTIDTE